MAEKLYSIDDKVRRLHNSICLYKGEPVYVLARHNFRGVPQLSEEGILVGPLGYVDVFNKNGWELVDYTSDDFSYDAFPLGYINIDGSAYYLSRMPFQQYTQGLTQNQLVVIGASTTGGSFPGRFFSSKEMAACILGKYPSFEEALKSNDPEVAFDRYFSLKAFSKRFIALMFQGRLVGYYSRKQGSLKIWGDKAARLITRKLDQMGIKYVIDDDYCQ